ncbi:PEP-CTERM/exosortase system-associated acyltransferase [Neptunomonas qingdaonensis]|uniref:N-acyl amino acid synthase, PEP-CTERM/exosortase system-associated n=1 Tax=Neptunomonas qingdaonensis TaxID=1045558 RepID=A0A1I2MSU9_9GAMM|nr:PEP-CTERM/exosortase system-associated acyltransferase [Neptunomonas qingdaonensis]SFF94552.1 N-acyl amino acid synthase, PEP-CTERM/exosortase system-associated [Neptunomonas qingdaonensis]
MQKSLAENFQRYFTVELAAEEALKREIFHTRFNVYCKEFEYESIEHFVEEQESDEFDIYSFHCLIRHKESRQVAGCVRLVPADLNKQDMILPFEKYCIDSLDIKFIEELKLNRATLCEISRLAVDGAFRRRSNEALDRFGNVQQLAFADEERRVFPLIAVSAFLASTSLTMLTGRTNVFAMMEPFLPRLLKRSGIVFHRAGCDVDYHGIRAPYFITTQSVLDNMKPELKELYDAINARICAEYRSCCTSDAV